MVLAVCSAKRAWREHDVIYGPELASTMWCMLCVCVVKRGTWHEHDVIYGPELAKHNVVLAVYVAKKDTWHEHDVREWAYLA